MLLVPTLFCSLLPPNCPAPVPHRQDLGRVDTTLTCTVHSDKAAPATHPTRILDCDAVCVSTLTCGQHAWTLSSVTCTCSDTSAMQTNTAVSSNDLMFASSLACFNTSPHQLLCQVVKLASRWPELYMSSTALSTCKSIWAGVHHSGSSQTVPTCGGPFTRTRYRPRKRHEYTCAMLSPTERELASRSNS